MTVTLNQTRIRPDDAAWDIASIGINYKQQRVMVRVEFQSGDTIDVIFEGTSLTNLRNSVSQFAGLRLSVEQYIAANRPDLSGMAT